MLKTMPMAKPAGPVVKGAPAAAAAPAAKAAPVAAAAVAAPVAAAAAPVAAAAAPAAPAPAAKGAPAPAPKEEEKAAESESPAEEEKAAESDAPAEEEAEEPEKPGAARRSLAVWVHFSMCVVRGRVGMGVSPAPARLMLRRPGLVSSQAATASLRLHQPTADPSPKPRPAAPTHQNQPPRLNPNPPTEFVAAGDAQDLGATGFDSLRK
jgi:hypothetical protein